MSNMFWMLFLVFRLNEGYCQERKMGGKVAKPGQFPYLVFILIDKKRTCTGSLISSSWVLTAAHCQGKEMKLIAGHSDRTSRRAQNRTSLRTIVHPKYTPGKIGDFDLALVNVEPFDMSSANIGLLRLQASEWPQDLQKSRVCKTAGWGMSDDNLVPRESRYTHVVAKHGSSSCSCIPARVLQPRLVCLDSQPARHPCYGDSGGPLICDGEGVGVTHMALSTSLCKPYAHSEPFKLCGDDQVSILFIYICPQLSWIRQYVPQVPIPPQSCKSPTIIKPIFILTFLYTFINFTTVFLMSA